MRATEKRRCEVNAAGLVLPERGGEVVPLYSGAMHYWRHAPEDWEPALDAIRAMGLRLVETYIPWGVHEVGPGDFDFGERRPRLDVARFLELAHARGLYAIVRPGPHINAELSYFGLPERVVWDPDCQARSPKGNPVILPILPVAFPIPSYASEKLHDEAAQWFDAVGRHLSRLRWPDGPIVMIQIDNEGAMYFRDGPYDQDWHPDAIRLFRETLRRKYETIGTLRAAWNDPRVTFATAEPPVRFDAARASDLAPHLDWIEASEALLAWAMDRFKTNLEAVGLGGVPAFHNLPPGEALTGLNPTRITGVLDFVGLDYYHPANPVHHAIVMRRTTELASRCEGRGVPAFGAEMGVGFPMYFAPLDDEDSLYTLMCALGYGLRGFNLYMAVDRDRWVGAPIDARGAPRPLADAYRALTDALVRTRFHELRRRAPVRLVVPRALRRLGRAMHAFGPVTPALFNVLGAGFRESSLEDDLGFGEVPTIAAETFLRTFERALVLRGVPFAYAGGESFDASTKGAAWIVCPTAGGIKPELLERLVEARARGAVVTIGPQLPARDGAMREVARAFDPRGVEVEPLDDAARADALVARRIAELGLVTYPCTPDEVYVSVHEDATGAPRAMFVMNPAREPVLARVAAAGIGELVDVVLHGPRAGHRFAPSMGAFEIEVPARTARMFAVEG